MTPTSILTVTPFEMAPCGTLMMISCASFVYSPPLLSNVTTSIGSKYGTAGGSCKVNSDDV